MKHIDTMHASGGKNLLDKVYPPEYFRGKAITRTLIDGKIPIWETDGQFFESRMAAYEYVKVNTPVGRPTLPDKEVRKPRSIKMSDEEWEEIRQKADALGLPISEYIRLKTLAGD